MNNFDSPPLKPDYRLLLWIVFFCYATVAALLFQKLLLPLVPSLHAGGGLLNNDAIYFHETALKLTEKIRLHGWSEFSIYPSGGGTGNVALLAVLYLLFGPDPALIIPVNAAFHATGGLLIYLLGRELWPGNAGRYGGLTAASLFVLFPSALNWYGQLHKDGYLIAGILMIAYSWVRALRQPVGFKTGAGLVLGTIAGILAVAFVRIYFLRVIFPACLLLWLFVAVLALGSRKLADRRGLVPYYFAALVLIGLGAANSHNIAKNLPNELGEEVLTTGMGYVDWESANWKWEKSPWLPHVLERPIEIAARTRAGLLYYNDLFKAGSGIDTDRTPRNVPEALAYLPRALQVGLLAPFPDTWLKNLSPMRLVAVLEMVVWYLLIPGVIVTVRRRPSPGLFLAMLFASFFLVVLGFVTPNLGTLYRIRYSYLFIFILIGALGWADVFLRRMAQPAKAAPAEPPSPAGGPAASVTAATSEDLGLPSRTEAVNAGAIVIGLTLLSYVGFFIRDILMARRFGVGSELDIFYIGIMLPMFLVAVFAMPAGAAITPVFMDIREKLRTSMAQRFVAFISLAITAFLGVLCLLLYLSGPALLPAICRNFSMAKLSGSLAVQNLFLPILLLSGLVIVGNSLLNALGRFLVPGLAQAVVPVAAIGALVLLSSRLGVLSVAVGMVIGQVLNLLIVALYLRKAGWSLAPKWDRLRLPEYRLINQYLQLAAAALFTSAVVPVDNAIAAMLGEGSVATLALGAKVVLFITGLIGAGVTSVMIPYFSSYAATERLIEARRELSFFLVVVTYLLLPVTLLFYLGSPAIARVLLQGGAMAGNDVTAIARVMQCGIIQLPFFTSGMLIMKFATAHRRAGLVLVASVVGLLLNAGLSLLFMRHLGVAGIALATTLALAISTGLLLMLLHRLGQIAWIDVLILFMSWLLFATLIVCLHFSSYTGIFAVLLAMVMLLAGQWQGILATWRLAGSRGG